MSLSTQLLLALVWDLVVLVLWAGWRFYRRSQRRLEQGVKEYRRGPDQAHASEPAAVTGPVPLVVEGEFVTVADCPVPTWMEKG